MAIPRRPPQPADVFSAVAARLWRGHVRVY